MRRLTVILMVVAALAVGCSSSSKKSSSATSTSPGGGASSTVQLETHDFSFSPTTIQATAGKAVKVTITNKGGVEHNFSITSLHVSKDVEKGESATVTFTPTQSGTLEFFCKYHVDSNGMKGSITVA